MKLCKSFGWAAVLFACNVVLIVPSATAGLFGPGKFEIKQIDDRFSNGPTITYMGQNNRISKKSPVGGIYTNDQGLYLEPMVVKNRVDNQIVKTGFFFHNETELDTTYGAPNSLGVPQKISFIVNGTKQISATVVKGGSEFGDGVQYNSIGGYASSSLRESGLIYVSMEDMAFISNAKSIAIKIEGSKRAVIYNEKDIAKTFVSNLAAFFAAKMGK